MTVPAKNKPTPTSELPETWTTFAQKLAAVLAKLEEDDYLCLSVKGSDRYVRFFMEGEFGMRVETPSNVFLEEQEQLDDNQIANLVAADWCAPTVTLDDLIDDDESDGSPNFFLDLNSPVSFEAVAALTVRTLSEILGVPSPEQLEYYAYDEEDEPIEFPELGLQLEESEEDGDLEVISQQLLETLRETIGVSDLEFDEDGDIGVRYRSALSFVRMNHDGLFVGMFAQLLTDVPENPDIFSRLNDINSNEIMVRVFYKEGVVYAVVDIPALPFVGTHVAEAFGYFCDAADRLGVLLQKEFGGETAFEEYTQSSMLH
jgi:hypothetical protein